MRASRQRELTLPENVRIKIDEVKNRLRTIFDDSEVRDPIWQGVRIKFLLFYILIYFLKPVHP